MPVSSPNVHHDLIPSPRRGLTLPTKMSMVGWVGLEDGGYRLWVIIPELKQAANNPPYKKIKKQIRPSLWWVVCILMKVKVNFQSISTIHTANQPTLLLVLIFIFF